MEGGAKKFFCQRVGAAMLGNFSKVVYWQDRAIYNSSNYIERYVAG
tara:strand:- start:79 stop:216 length:138 start_codon:yes stop_codon:yes gene_type:complete